MALVRGGDTLAIHLTRRAGRLIGIALADAVSLLNPGLVVVTGDLTDAGEHLFAGLRETVYRRSLPLATRRLAIVPTSEGTPAGVRGLVVALTDVLYAPSRVDALLGFPG